MYNAYIPGGEPYETIPDFTTYLKKKAVPFPGC